MIPLCSFPEKKVCKNTFQAFTGKLDKPIESKSKGGNGSLEGWMLLTSLNHEQSARYGYAISLQIINEREVPGNTWEFTEKKKTRFYWKIHKRGSWLEFVRQDDGPIYSAYVFTEKYNYFQEVYIYLDLSLLFQPLLSPCLSGETHRNKQNSSQVCSTIVCRVLWHDDLHFARHFG